MFGFEVFERGEPRGVLIFEGFLESSSVALVVGAVLQAEHGGAEVSEVLYNVCFEAGFLSNFFVGWGGPCGLGES